MSAVEQSNSDAWRIDMTREELIYELNNRIGFETDNERYAMSETERDFYKSILDIIEKEPCEDCVSRQAVIKTIFEQGSAEKLEIDFAKLLLLQRKIKALPPVTPQQKTGWIPVSERLPLCEQEVLICTQSRSIDGKTKSIITSAIYEDGNMRECYSRWHWEDIEYESWDEEEDCGIIPEGWWEYRHYNPDEVYNNLVDNFILAWMPLPQPYRTESENSAKIDCSKTKCENCTNHNYCDYEPRVEGEDERKENK